MRRLNKLKYLSLPICLILLSLATFLVQPDTTGAACGADTSWTNGGHMDIQEGYATGDRTWHAVRQGQTQNFGFALKNVNSTYSWNTTNVIRIIHSLKRRGKWDITASDGPNYSLIPSASPAVFGGNALVSGNGTYTCNHPTDASGNPRTTFPSVTAPSNTNTPAGHSASNPATAIGPNVTWFPGTNFNWTPAVNDNTLLGYHGELYSIRHKFGTNPSYENTIGDAAYGDLGVPFGGASDDIANLEGNYNYELATTVVPYAGLDPNDCHSVGYYRRIYTAGDNRICGKQLPRVTITYTTQSGTSMNLSSTVSDGSVTFDNLSLSPTARDITVRIEDVETFDDSLHQRVYYGYNNGAGYTETSTGSREDFSSSRLQYQDFTYSGAQTGIWYTFYGQVMNSDGWISKRTNISIRFTHRVALVKSQANGTATTWNFNYSDNTAPSTILGTYSLTGSGTQYIYITTPGCYTFRELNVPANWTVSPGTSQSVCLSYSNSRPTITFTNTQRSIATCGLEFDGDETGVTEGQTLTATPGVSGIACTGPSCPANHSSLTWTLNWGDGSAYSSQWGLVPENGTTPSHQYAKAGDYTAILTPTFSIAGVEIDPATCPKTIGVKPETDDTVREVAP